MIYQEKKTQDGESKRDQKKVIMEFSHMLLMEHELSTNETIKSEWIGVFMVQLKFCSHHVRKS